MIVTRRGYGGRGLDRVFPLDAELNLPLDKYSHGLREVLVEEVVRGSFDEAAVQLSEDFDAFYDQPLAPSHAVRDAGKILGISADGKGMVMQPNGRREATRRALARQEHTQHTRLSPGEKKNRRRMATVVSLYEVDPYPRTAEQILDLEQPPDGRRPRPSNQRTWARVQADQGTVLEQSVAEAMRRDPDRQLRWVVLTDGQEELLRQVDAAARRYKVDIVVVQDFRSCPRVSLAGRLCAAP